MLKLLNPKDHYVSAILDAQGNAVKIECDLLVAAHYVIDTKTSIVSLTVTFEKADDQGPIALPKIAGATSFYKAGPMVQHMIIGEELVQVIEGGITIEGIEESVLRTGIPSANIAVEDLELYEAGWRVDE